MQIEVEDCLEKKINAKIKVERPNRNWLYHDHATSD